MADIEKAVQYALDVAADDSHGYNQGSARMGQDYDCSSLVGRALVAAGYDYPADWSPSTAQMGSHLEAIGFAWHPGTGGVKRGDILWVKGHTAMAISSTQIVEAYPSHGHLTGDPAGDQGGGEISVKALGSHKWTGYWRAPDAGASASSGFYPTIIDVSSWQGDIDWEEAKPYIHFAIIRVQDGRNTPDRKLARNVSECKRLGIPFYLYGFYRGGGDAEATTLVERVIAAGGTGNLGLICDLEVSGYSKSGVRAYINRLKAQGGRTGLYVANHLYGEYGAGYGEDWVWIPVYGPNDGKAHAQPKHPCDLWQFTSAGTVPGIDGNVDCNACVNKPLSWFLAGATETAPDPEPDPEPAEQLKVDGYWGEGTTREVQRQAGTAVDGEIWGQNADWKPYFKGCTTGWKWETLREEITGSPAIKAVQRCLRDKHGQDVGDIDGIAGRKFWRALERAAGYPADEKGLEAPSNSIKWFQRELNAGTFF